LKHIIWERCSTDSLLVPSYWNHQCKDQHLTSEDVGPCRYWNVTLRISCHVSQGISRVDSWRSRTSWWELPHLWEHSWSPKVLDKPRKRLRSRSSATQPFGEPDHLTQM
jgi:hypothetical protein